MSKVIGVSSVAKYDVCFFFIEIRIIIKGMTSLTPKSASCSFSVSRVGELITKKKTIGETGASERAVRRSYFATGPSLTVGTDFNVRLSFSSFFLFWSRDFPNMVVT